MPAVALTFALAASLAGCGPEAPAVTVDSDESLTLIDHPGEALEFVGFEWEIRNGEGQVLPPDLLHHVNLIDPDSRELFTPISRRVLAAGRENQRESIPGVIGFPLEEGGRMLIATMFGNPLGEDYGDVYLHFKLMYSRADEGLIKPKTVYPFYLDVMGFDGVKDFEVPPGHSEMSYTAHPGVDARILGIGGHVHDYASELRLEDATTGEILWRAEPIYNEAGRMVGVPSSKFILQLGKKIYKDREYRVVVEYENPLDVPAPDMGMGAIGGVVAIMGDGEWPAYDPDNPAYVQDLNNTITAPDRMEGHGHGGGHSARPMEGMTDMEMPAAGQGEGAAEGEGMDMPAGHHPEPEKAGGHDHDGQAGKKQGDG
jgi:hypothetical protein